MSTMITVEAHTEAIHSVWCSWKNSYLLLMCNKWRVQIWPRCVTLITSLSISMSGASLVGCCNGSCRKESATCNSKHITFHTLKHLLLFEAMYKMWVPTICKTLSVITVDSTACKGTFCVVTINADIVCGIHAKIRYSSCKKI